MKPNKLISNFINYFKNYDSMVTLTADQKEDFESLKSAMVNQIKTEPGLTMLQKELALKNLKDNKEYDFYITLKNAKPSAETVALYLSGLTRRTKDRSTEARRAASHPSAHKETTDKKIRAAIGYSMSESKDRVIKELKRLENKSDATWKSIEKASAMTKKQILKYYGI